jgi:hypothetical protein
MVSDQVQRYRLGSTPSDERQQVQRGWVVAGEPVERHLPRRGDRHGVGPTAGILGQQLVCSLVDQP